MNDRTEVAIIAAMEREIAPLVRGWEMIFGPRYHYYERGNVIAVAGGIGPEAARQVTETLLTFRQPLVVISAGFAGALRQSLTVGSILVPTKVLSNEKEQTFRIGEGEGTLVSTAAIVNAAAKQALAAKYAADAVDMEAASVAEIAQSRGVRFLAVKAVSDDARFAMPPLGRFIDDHGKFRTSRFVAYASVRPGMWAALGKLKRNTDQAANALCEYLGRINSAADVDLLFRSVQAG
ncbi:MAG: hypothetical protein ACM3JB_11805 [Acidobacteriaceae bacterium]